MDALQFRGERVPVGQLFRYTKSNLDGSYPARLSLWVTSEAHMVVMKEEAHGQDVALVEASWAWARFSLATLTSWIMDRAGKHGPMARLLLDEAGGGYVVQLGPTEEMTAVPQWPCHLFNFDFLSLAMLFPHLVEPPAGFTTGILQPTFAPAPAPLIRYEGQIAVTHERLAKVHGQLCHRFRLHGPGLQQQQGSLWARQADGIVELIEVPLPDNPDWQSFRLELNGQQPCTPDEWEAIVQAAIETLR